MYTVKENGDGTVTIDREVYNELHRKASEYQKFLDIVLNALKTAFEMEQSK